ncbi:MAG: aspartate aminotransferase family protein [Methylococcaceae bacterium]|nr:aspartate aminotransferase family protein [Methylococcaceae bacterium]
METTSHIMPTYARLPVSFERGEGVWLWDNQGNRYLDALSGIAVCGLGHCHPAVREAICAQAGRLIHTSNLYGIERQEELAADLARLSGLDKVFFCNSGTEANEAAIKIARRFGHQQQIEFPEIVVMENSFHGRTLGALSATGNDRVREGFGPLLEGFPRIPFDNIDALEEIAASHPNIVAVFVEPVQGEAGIRVPKPDYLPRLREICDRNRWLLMLDEIQTGIGRSGKFLAYQLADILPDVCTLAKALGNGLPIGACMARGKAAEVLSAGTHGSTFGGNPLACAAAIAVIQTLEQQNLSARAGVLGGNLRSEFSRRLNSNPAVVDVRGLGLMIGIELDRACGDLANEALQEKILISVQADKSIRLLPPLIMDEEQAERIVSTLCPLIDRFTASARR